MNKYHDNIKHAHLIHVYNLKNNSYNIKVSIIL